MDKQFVEIGKRIREARNKRRLTQAELADMVGIAHSHMSDIENGKTKLGVDILISLSEQLQVSSDWILRANIPTVTAALRGDVAELLSDCTADEGQLYVKIMKDAKEAVREYTSKKE